MNYRPMLLIALLCGCSVFSEPLSLDEKLQREVRINDIKNSMAVLAKEMEQDKTVSAFCHSLAHSIGHAAYEKNGLKALEEANNLCGSGFFHGVIERHFAKAKDVLLTFKTICNSNDGRCFHGLGHGLMFASTNDLPASIELCSQLATSSQAITCSEGVFMENFNTNDAFHTTSYKKPEDPFYPCNLQQQPYKSVCTFYAVRYYLQVHEHDHDNVAKWCNSLGTDVQDTCIKGIGSALTKYHLQELDIPTSTCDTLNEPQRTICYSGIVSYIIVHNASPTKGQKWCNTLTGDLQRSCMKIAQDSQQYYEPGA